MFPMTTPLAFGCWRLFLATLVASSHLWSSMIQGYAAYAVWGFFVLSGYLMTYILSERYGTNARGLGHYAWNRFLRIYPTYWLALFLGIVALTVLPPMGVMPDKLNAAFTFPRTLLDWVFPFTLLIQFPSYFLPVPIAKALGIEIAYYCLMPFFTSSKLLTWSCLLLAFAYNIILYYENSDFYDRYMSLLPCALPFTAGSLCYHYRRNLRPLISPLISTSIWILHGLIVLSFPAYPWFYGLLVSVLLSAWVTISLADQKASTFDGLLGDLSYPLYLLHTTVAAFFLIPFGHERNVQFFTVSFASAILLSFLVSRYFETPLRSYRFSDRTTVSG